MSPSLAQAPSASLTQHPLPCFCSSSSQRTPPVRGFPCCPAAVGHNASLVSDINFCAENPVGAGVTNGFYLLLENTALSHPPAHCTHKPFFRLAEPNPGSREQSCPAAPSVSASIYVGPWRLHLLRRAAYLMSCWKEIFGLPRPLC